MHSGWLFDAESNRFRVVRSMFSEKDITDLLKCKQATYKQFDTSDGAYCIWWNEDIYAQAYFNEGAQCILASIQIPWKSFHGNFLVTYKEKSNIWNSMPNLTVDEFVDVCNHALKQTCKNC